MILKISAVFIIIFFSACSTKNHGTAFKIEPIHKVKNTEGIFSLKLAKKIDMLELVKEVEHYPIIFVGDHHDSNKTHKFFKEFLKALSSKGYNIHLANEWFTPNDNNLLESYTTGEVDIKKLQDRTLKRIKKLRWEISKPIYKSVKSLGGRLYGVNISKDDRKKISLKQLDKMDAELKSFYDSLDLNVSAHRSMIMPFFEHCGKMKKHKEKSSEPCQDRMYRVQVTWDSYMAKESAKLAKKVIKTKKDKLIIFAGAMHIEYGVGIAMRFARLSNLASYTISNHRFSEDNESLIDPNLADSIFLYKVDQQ